MQRPEYSLLPSMSGGKDSTAMLLMMLEKGIPFLDPIFFDTGWEFPEIYEHIERFEEKTGVNVVRLASPKSFNEWLLRVHVRYSAQSGYELVKLEKPNAHSQH